MRKSIIITMVFMPLLAACSHTPSVQSVVAPITYKIDLQQGNVVTQEMVAKLRQGMTPPQVRYVLGSPLVTDSFHPDRWDYVYLFEKGHKVTEHHRLTVIFTDGKLARLEGDVELQDTLQAPEQSVATPAPAGTVAPTTIPGASIPASPAASTQATDAKSGAAPLATAPAQPVAAPPPGTASSNDTAQPNATTSPAATPAAGNTNTNTNTNTNQPAAEADATKSDSDQNQKQRGFFGRMLDKIGL